MAAATPIAASDFLSMYVLCDVHFVLALCGNYSATFGLVCYGAHVPYLVCPKSVTCTTGA